MNNKENINPLSDPQREKAGAQTFEDYAYQYHWALYEVISKHEQQSEYAVFIELHEDVVISNSLDSRKATFEFNQVKTTKPKFTLNQLIKKKNGKSVLGKLISSGLNKSFSNKISELNLVALNDFSIDLKNKGIKLDKIRLEDLSKNHFDQLEKAIKDELQINALPANIQFIVPELSEKNFQNDVIASIAKLITSIYPESRYDAVGIYRLLYDDITKKGVVTYDFTKWDELLSKKALTSITIIKVINQFSNIKDETTINIEFNQICDELELKTIKRNILKRSFGRYRNLRLSNNSTIQINTTKTISKIIKKDLNNGTEDIKNLIKNVAQEIPDKIKKHFTSDDELNSAIICEYIMMENE
jgi:Cap4-like dsDNA endonuclease family protein